MEKSEIAGRVAGQTGAGRSTDLKVTVAIFGLIGEALASGGEM